MAKVPFVPMHPGWWPDIAAGLAKPWPAEAVWMDLRWWKDQEQRGREDRNGVPIKRPGRPTLERRWGWTSRQAKKALKAENVWRDPYKGGDQDAASERPGSDQDAASERPEYEPQDSDSVEHAASERPASGQDAASERSESGPARVLSQPSTDPPSTVHPLPPTPLSGGASAERPRRVATTQPNFGEQKPASASQPLPPPKQLADRDAFVQRWGLYAEEFYPGQPSQRWESTTLAARRGHGPGGFFASPRDEAKEQAMLEFGPHLLPMLDRYAECCRGDHGEGARRAFERGDFEGRRMLSAMHLWVTTGKAPHWVTVTPWKPDATPPNRRRAEAEGSAVDNAFLEPEGSP